MTGITESTNKRAYYSKRKSDSKNFLLKKATLQDLLEMRDIIAARKKELSEQAIDDMMVGEVDFRVPLIPRYSEKDKMNALKLLCTHTIKEVTEINGMSHNLLQRIKRNFVDLCSEHTQDEVAEITGLDLTTIRNILILEDCWNKGFGGHQIREVKLGLKQGVDVSFYAKKEFLSVQMRRIREGLEKGLDISFYANPEFDDKQMQQILWGLEKGLDVSTYATAEIDSYKMYQIRKSLQNKQNK